MGVCIRILEKVRLAIMIKNGKGRRKKPTEEDC
jgi:hypothetical protein